MRVLVAGGGIGGLAAALALARTGWIVTLHEQAPELREVGAGVQLSPNAVKALRWLGVEPALADAACAPERIEVRRWRDDRLLATAPLGREIAERHGAPYWHLARADLQAALLAAAEGAGAQVRLGSPLSPDDGAIAGADLTVAADGVRSAFRSRFFDATPSRTTGCMAWRGLVDASDLPETARRLAAVVRVGPGRHFVSYPVAGGRRVNFVGVVESAGAASEAWGEPEPTAALAADFKGWPADVQALVAACPAPVRWAVLDRPPESRWVRGRVVLLGDAAHPVPPYLAQGAALALEDAVVLARCLSEGRDMAVALDTYQRSRRPRAARVLGASRRNAFAFHARGPIAWAGQTGLRVLERARPGALGRSLDWLYGYDPART